MKKNLITLILATTMSLFTLCSLTTKAFGDERLALHGNNMKGNPTYDEKGKLKTGWESYNGNWKFYYVGYLVTNRFNVGGKEYYFDKQGNMQTGWVKIDRQCYYFGSDGAMLKGEHVLNGVVNVFCDTNGVWCGTRVGNFDILPLGWFEYGDKKWRYRVSNSSIIHGWLHDEGDWYFFDYDTCIMRTDWVKVKEKWYFFNHDGKMQTGWQSINGHWYFLSSDGAMKIGWLNDNGTWYYFNGSGAMVTGEYTINDIKHNFNDSGIWTGEVKGFKNGWILENESWCYYNNGTKYRGWLSNDNKWYHLNNYGFMDRGWISTNGHWYFLNSDGSMKIGWFKEGNKWYYLNTSGAMVTSNTTINNVGHAFNSNGIWKGEIKNVPVYTGKYWIANNNSKYYHDSSECSNMGHPSEVTYEYVKTHRLIPCNKCHSEIY